MIEDYNKKVVDSPVVKKKKVFVVPEGWDLYEKRGKWCLRSPQGKLSKFATKKAAELFCEEMS